MEVDEGAPPVVDAGSIEVVVDAGSLILLEPVSEVLEPTLTPERLDVNTVEVALLAPEEVCVLVNQLEVEVELLEPDEGEIAAAALVLELAHEVESDEDRLDNVLGLCVAGEEAHEGVKDEDALGEAELDVVGWHACEDRRSLQRIIVDEVKPAHTFKQDKVSV